MRTLYSAAWYLLAPAVAVWLVVLGLRDRGWLRGLRERLGLVAEGGGDGIWLHAASVGEVQAALPLVQALRLQYPDLPVTLTAFTPSGRDHALRQLSGDVRCALLPLDFPGATARFLERVRPRIGVIIETELWPNLYAACERRGVPLLIVSARVTDAGARAYRRIGGLIARTLAVPEVISAQTDADAQRLQALGAAPTRVTVGGNVKFDFRLPPGIDSRVDALRSDLGVGGRPVWIAASTHDGEEAQVLDAHRAVLAARADALLVLAPRHPGRADGIAELVRARGFALARRSAGDRALPETGVYLLDTLGELAAFYGIADVAFVGGTLVPVGGHNLLEPAAFGLPLLCGPHVHTIGRMHALLADAGAVTEVGDGEALAAEVTRLLDDDALRMRTGDAARRVLERNRGAVERAVHLVQGFLG